jgi:ketosteroid isomerase-like protein
MTCCVRAVNMRDRCFSCPSTIRNAPSPVGGSCQGGCMENGGALAAELDGFLAEYERRTNAHDVGRLRELIAEDASYWFTDGSYEGVEAIAAAVQRTFDEIRDEVYTISEAQWVCTSPDWAVVRYRFHWVGFVDGRRCEGRGRGTNAMGKRSGRWQMIHEHLST